MITEGKELGFIRIPEVKIDEVKKSMSKLRCPFSIIEDLNPNDGLVEFAYHVNDSAKVSEMIKSTGIGEIISFEDYINNADAEYIQNEVREMEQSELKKASAPDISETSEPAKFNRNNRELYNKQNQMTITINKETLVMATTSEDILTRIPGSEGKDFVVFNFDDEKIKITDDNQTYVVKLNKNKQYDILDKSGAVTGKISGKTLKENYDKVFRDFNKNKQKVPTAIHSLTPTVKPSTKKI
jgi:hypothetical protein